MVRLAQRDSTHKHPGGSSDAICSLGDLKVNARDVVAHLVGVGNVHSDGHHAGSRRTFILEVRDADVDQDAVGACAVRLGRLEVKRLLVVDAPLGAGEHHLELRRLVAQHSHTGHVVPSILVEELQRAEGRVAGRVLHEREVVRELRLGIWHEVHVLQLGGVVLVLHVQERAEGTGKDCARILGIARLWHGALGAATVVHDDAHGRATVRNAVDTLNSIRVAWQVQVASVGGEVLRVSDSG